MNSCTVSTALENSGLANTDINLVLYAVQSRKLRKSQLTMRI